MVACPSTDAGDRPPVGTHAIPLGDDKYIIYLPLRRLAFVGNGAMADLALYTRGSADLSDPESDARVRDSGPRSEGFSFLDSIGFFAPDPMPPTSDDCEFKPSRAVLLLTNDCQLRCVYCYASAGEVRRQEMTEASARAVVDVASGFAESYREPLRVSFHGGGEPTLAWNTLVAATDHARSLDGECVLSVTSNGMWSETQCSWLIENMDEFTLSMDGRASTQDRQRPLASGAGSSRIVMRSVRALDASASRYGIRLTACAPWGDQLVEDVRYICEHTGCPTMQVEPAFGAERGRPRAPTRREGDAFIEGFVDAYAVARRAGRHLVYSGARPWLVTDRFCTAPYDSLIARPDCTLVACFQVVDRVHPLDELSCIGRIHDGELDLDADRRAALLEQIEAGRDECNECFCRWHCAGDCYVRRLEDPPEDGGPRGPGGVRCNINRAITAEILQWQIAESGGIWRGDWSGPDCEDPHHA